MHVENGLGKMQSMRRLAERFRISEKSVQRIVYRREP